MEILTPIKAVTRSFDGLGFERVKVIPGSTFRENKVIIICPTRGQIHHRVYTTFQNLMKPMNGKVIGPWFPSGHEVGIAYNEAIKQILADPNLSKFDYVMTIEDDNLLPPDALIRLLESIEFGPFDAVSGIYFTKGEYNMPMAYGDPDHFTRTGELEFRPRDIASALDKGQIMRVNGIAMGCALWRMNLYRQIAAPWYETVCEYIPDKGARAQTQDLNFCEKAIRAGKTFAVDMRVKVGHLDINSGEVY